MGHVRTLALDTSSPDGSIAVLRESECLGMVSTRTDEVYSSRLFRHLQFLLDELSLNLEEFDLFAVCSRARVVHRAARGARGGEGMGRGVSKADRGGQRPGSRGRAIPMRRKS